MENFNALLTLSELKTLYSGKPVGICPLYQGVLNATKTFEATGNPITIPEYTELVKLTTQFSPKQAGTGDPSPDNVRPISGWDSVKVTVSNESESHDYNITLPETIYGGTVDGVTGEGEKTWEFVEFDGTEGWYLYDATSVAVKTFVLHIGIEPYTNIYINAFCDRASFLFSNWSQEEPWTIGSSHLSDAIYFSVPNEIASTTSNFKSYLAAQAAAGTPVQVAYKLATPEPFEASQVSIPSLGGENNFFTNAENMDIIYKETIFWG